MRRNMWYNVFLATVCLGFILSMVPAQSFAFSAIKCGDAEYTIYGFLRNNTGMFTQTQEYGGSGNQLATERTWLRTYADLKFNENFRVWIATQFVYEPWYKVEEGNPVAENGGPQQHRKPGWKTYSEFDDINDVIREAYFEWKIDKKNSLKVGRQIAIWGEALTGRVGDVVHPDDGRFAFGFSNLEDTRIPQWMVRGVHDVPFLPNTSFEWLAIAPLVEGQYYVNRLTTASAIPQQRFSIQPEDRDTTLEPLPHAPSSLIPSFALFGDRSGPKEIYPDGSAGWRYGAKTTTLLGGYQFSFSYFHTHSYDPVSSWGADRPYHVWVPGVPFPVATVPTRDLYLTHPYMDIIGASVNKQLPWPGVLRAEVVYSPNKPFVTFDIGATDDGIVRRDWVKYLVGYDLTGFFYPSWHKDASFDVSLEHIGEWIPNARDLQYGPYYTKMPSYHAGFNVKLSTTWLYNKIGTMIIAGYDTFSNSWLFMPIVSYTPAWQNEKLSFELRYVGITADSKYEGLGILKNKDMVLLTTQFNF